MYHVMSAFCPILPSDCFSTIALNNPREGQAIATKKDPQLFYWVERLNSWRRKLSALPMAGPCPEDMTVHGRTWQTTKVNEKKVNEACSPFDKHLNWVIKGILHTSANSRVYLWKIWKLHRGTSRATYFSDFFHLQSDFQRNHPLRKAAKTLRSTLSMVN